MSARDTQSASLEADMPAREAALDIVAIEQVTSHRFTGLGGLRNHSGTVFGGRMVAQALHAALRTVPDLPLTSVHAYFLAPGSVHTLLDYEVTALRDSRRFANRQVTVHQSGKLIFILMCQFHAPESGFSHQYATMPQVPAPDGVMPLQQYVRERDADLDLSAISNFSQATPIEMRPVDPDAYFMERPAHSSRDFWFRLSSAASVADPRLQQCLLAFASDYWLAGSAAIPHVLPTNGEKLLISSLDHAIWFHAPIRCDDWLLHHTRSPAASDGLGFATGQIFDRQGNLLASTSQECLLRRLGD
jgi:acyl-CoA thioesterase-2